MEAYSTAVRVHRAATMCWMCTYQGEELGKKLHNFIIKNIGVMDIYCISLQVSDFLHLTHPEAADSSKEDMHAHISTHMLHPRVRLAVMLRQLLDFAALLQNNIVTREGDLCTVEKSNAELYLKVISQVMTLYKADTHGMIFADDDNGSKDMDSA